MERLEELIEPDVGKEHLGAAVAPHDVASLLSALRLLTRVLPFVVGCPSTTSSSDGEDQATTAARAVHEHIWGAPSRVMKTDVAAVQAEEAALLANALQWRRAESVGGEGPAPLAAPAAPASPAPGAGPVTAVAAADDKDYRDANPRAAAAAHLADTAVDLAGGPPPVSYTHLTLPTILLV